MGGNRGRRQRLFKYLCLSLEIRERVPTFKAWRVVIIRYFVSDGFDFKRSSEGKVSAGTGLSWEPPGASASLQRVQLSPSQRSTTPRGQSLHSAVVNEMEVELVEQSPWKSF